MTTELQLISLPHYNFHVRVREWVSECVSHTPVSIVHCEVHTYAKVTVFMVSRAEETVDHWSYDAT
jgi:hypothetical protein